MSISNKGKIVIALGVLVVLAGGSVVAAVRIKAKYIDPQPVTQPIDFNHKLHMDKNADLTCETCHKGVADSRYASIPAVTTCVKLCHSEAPEGCTHPDEPKLREYVAKGEPIRWNQANNQPGHVFFSHVAHVKWGGMDCKECHGDMRNSEKSVTMTQTNNLNMSTCMKCHEEKGVSNDCLLCHQ